MKKELFEELLQSLLQGGAILRGKMGPSRVYEFPDPDVRILNVVGETKSRKRQ
jgi:hypothetical protein